MIPKASQKFVKHSNPKANYGILQQTKEIMVKMQQHENLFSTYTYTYHLRTSKHRNIFSKGYTPNWFEEVFVIKKLKDTVLWTNMIEDCNSGAVLATFYEQETQKKKSIRV